MEKHKNNLDTFLVSSKTKDGYKFAVGGICIKEYKDACSDRLKSLNKIQLGGKNSGYFIDYMFSSYIRDLSSPYIKAVCGSINASNKGYVYGGIIGSPHSIIKSSCGKLEIIEENIYVIAFPGSFGIAFVSNYYEAMKIYLYLLKLIIDTPLDEAMRIAVSYVESLTDIFIISSDGSGEEGFGAVYTSRQNWSVL